MTRSLGDSAPRYVIVYSRASDPRPRTSSTLSRFTSRPRTPVTRARSTGSRRGAPPAGTRGPRNAVSARGLILLDVDQEHVRRVGGQVERELPEQVRLHRAHADDEEAAQPDGKQHEARLVAGTVQMQRRVTQREPARVPQRPRHLDQQPAGAPEHAGDDDEAAADDERRHARSRPARRPPRPAPRRPAPRRPTRSQSRGRRPRLPAAAAATAARAARAAAARSRTAAPPAGRSARPARRPARSGHRSAARRSATLLMA